MPRTDSSPTHPAPITRATDADRTRTADLLGRALGRGALEPEEHEARLDRALRAQDRGALADLVVDLPGAEPGELAQQRRDRDLAAWIAEWRWWAGGAVILTAIWGAQALRSGPDTFWPVVPLAVWAAVLIAVAIWPGGDD